MDGRSRMRLLLRLRLGLGLTLMAAVATGVLHAQDGTPAREGRLGVAAGTAGVGERVLVQGRVLDTAGRPVPGAVVELWQADANGNYRHPRDASPDELLPDFQYFGTSTAGPDGGWAFLTVKPSPYGARPAHLHLRVVVEGREALTSQLYFEEDLPAVEADPVSGGAGRALLLRAEAGRDGRGEAPRLARADLVLDLGGRAAGALEPTPRQTEGPYYPREDFSGWDNDLTRAATGQPPVKPAP